MTVSAGARLGPYEIVAPLGAGGMGEVDEKQLASTKFLQVVQNWLPELLRRVPVR